MWMLEGNPLDALLSESQAPVAPLNVWFQPLTQHQLDDANRADFVWCRTRTADYVKSHPSWDPLSPCVLRHTDAATVNDQRRATAAGAIQRDLSRPLRPTFITVVIAAAFWFAISGRGK
jgi:hypothetical protein